MSHAPLELLDAAESRAADQAAIRGGIPGITLMENAGAAVVHTICRAYAPRPALVLCGPGNNGGDGFIVARLLRECGWEVAVALVGYDSPASLKGDAAQAAARWHEAGGHSAKFHPSLLAGAHLLVDALFGAGLTRPPEGKAREAILAANASGAPIVAVDIPSGVLADTGEAETAIRAARTVTFFRAKPGHYLLPGRAHAGEITVADIGIIRLPDTIVCTRNVPALWRAHLPRFDEDAHKYARGHAVVKGGGMAATGAARMAAEAAMRTGAGLVSVACPPGALPVYAAALTAVMVKPVKDAQDFAELLSDERITAMLVGPHNGVTGETRAHALAALATGRPLVLDADALSIFAPPHFPVFHPACVLTPHEGEFARLFPGLTGPRIARARAAAKLSGAVVLLKGSDTIIAAPDGRTAVNQNAPPWLATAGSGDVLAGIITGLLAQKMPAFEAACGAAWLHAEAAHLLGPGLLADELPGALPRAMQRI